ncbi:MAG: ankyrin repeat domain-containing protein [Thermodesulfobacteriota bacterium]
MKRLLPLLLIIALSSSFSGCAVTGTALTTASFKGQTDVVKDILNKGADVNERSGCGLGWDPNVTALTCAAHGGHMETVKVLIEKGADVNARSNDGWTPLVSAAYAGHADIAKLLIERGADVDVTMAFLDRWPLGKDGFKLLERLVKKQPSRQPEIVAAKPSPQARPAIKSDVDEPPSIKAKLNKNAYAIVIGIEEYRQKLPKADFADADAKIISEYLTQTMGYPEENVVLLTNDKALQSDLAKYFEKWLQNNVEKGGTVFIYYSGHGAPDPKTGGAYLVPYDGDPSFIAETGFSLQRLYDALGKLQAGKVIVALDSCFSGAGGRSVIAKGARPLVMNLQSAIVPAKNITILSASSGDQISSTYDEKGHGLFTYFMLKGIKNEDVIAPDGSIRVDDLFGYLKPQVERIARKQYNNEQTPQLIGGK